MNSQLPPMYDSTPIPLATIARDAPSRNETACIDEQPRYFVLLSSNEGFARAQPLDNAYFVVEVSATELVEIIQKPPCNFLNVCRGREILQDVADVFYKRAIIKTQPIPDNDITTISKIRLTRDHKPYLDNINELRKNKEAIDLFCHRRCVALVDMVYSDEYPETPVRLIWLGSAGVPNTVYRFEMHPSKLFKRVADALKKYYDENEKKGFMVYDEDKEDRPFEQWVDYCNKAEEDTSYIYASVVIDTLTGIPRLYVGQAAGNTVGRCGLNSRWQAERGLSHCSHIGAITQSILHGREHERIGFFDYVCANSIAQKLVNYKPNPTTTVVANTHELDISKKRKKKKLRKQSKPRNNTWPEKPYPNASVFLFVLEVVGDNDIDDREAHWTYQLDGFNPITGLNTQETRKHLKHLKKCNSCYQMVKQRRGTPREKKQDGNK